MQFRVRMRESDKISSKQGLLKGSIYFAHLRVGEYEIVKNVVRYGESGYMYQLCVWRIENY
jgi:hypothetical protein